MSHGPPPLVRSDAVLDRERHGIPHPEPFLVEITIGDGEMSRVIEHVSNIEYVRWLDRAAEMHSDSVGMTRESLLDDGRMWFVARHEIDYCAEALRDDRLVIATWVRTIKRVKTWRDYMIVRPSDEIVICRAATLWVLIDLDTRRPRRIPRELVELFAPCGETTTTVRSG